MRRESGGRPPRYGWVLVALCFFVLGIGCGNQYANGVFIESFKQRFDASSPAILLGTAGVSSAVVGLFAPAVGLLLRRVSIRLILSIGMAAMGIGYVAQAFAAHYWQLVAIHGLLFSTGLASATIAGSALITNWFAQQRALALGIATSGMYALGGVVPPLANWGLSAVGFAATCLILAGTILALLPLVWVLVRDQPAPGVPERGTASPVPMAGGATWTLARLLRQPVFWTIAALVAVFTGIEGTLIINLMPIAQSSGIDRQSAAYVISLSAQCALASILTLGFVFDRVGQRTVAMVPLLLLIVACGLLLGSASLVRFVAASIVLGVALGATTLAPRVLIASLFGRDGFGLAFGMVTPAIVVVYLIALSGFGYLFDRLENPAAALWIVLAVLAGALLLILALPPAAPNGRLPVTALPKAEA